ncbi:hypothetical protein K1719_020714 [Acacia pycnantha]|nr:hypothetical protein K1719_020714 [Acacia pycnantha]
MLVAIMRTYDPPTNQFRIRGKTLEIQGEDVSQLLGVPRCGEEVTMNVLKDLYANLMGIINDGHKKLVASVEDELRKAQTHIERQWKQQVGEEDDGEDSQDGHDYEAQEGHRDGYEDDAYQDDASIGTPINIDEFDGESASVGGTNEGEQSKSIVLYPVQYPVQQEGGAQQEDAAPRRSMRAKKPKIKSPWILTKPLKRARKAKEDKEEKEILFDIISGPTPRMRDNNKILIQIDDEDITREQLQTLGRRNRLSNRVMSVVCKTLMLDMKREGQSQVRRHIFSADQMNLLNIKPVGWKVSEWKQQLLPQYIGYNMCDCDLIMGPMLVAEHWFCMAIDPSTMNFYVLDSMNTKVYLSKNRAGNKKKTAGASPQAKAIAKISKREAFLQFSSFHFLLKFVNSLFNLILSLINATNQASASSPPSPSPWKPLSPPPPLLKPFSPTPSGLNIVHSDIWHLQNKGKTREIDGKDVAHLLGVPHKGDEVTMNVSDTDPVLQQLRKEYGKMKYDDVLNLITSGESGEKFEMLFMMHMLGTFLAPTSSTTPAEKFLKVLKDLHGELMGVINDSHRRLVAAVEDKLRKAQDHIERQRKQQADEADDEADADYNGQHADVDDNGQHLDSDDEGEEGDGDHHDDGESGYDDDKAP